MNWVKMVEAVTTMGLAQQALFIAGGAVFVSGLALYVVLIVIRGK